MKKQVQIFGYVFIYLLVSSCGNPRPEQFKTVQALPITDTLSAKIISIEDETKLLNPLHILNVNDQYLVISEYRENDFLQVFRLPEVDFLYTWGSQGQGPNEFDRPPVYFNVRDQEIIPYEDVSRNLRFYRVTDTAFVKSGKDVRLSYEGQMDPLNRIRRINDTLFVADYGSSMEDTNHEHIALRPGENKPLFTFGNYPETELEGFHRYGVYLKTNISKPDGLKFAAFYKNHNMFKIYNSAGEELIVIQVDDPFFPEEDKNERSFVYRYTAWASEKYIYLLGLNGPEEKIFEELAPTLNTSLEIWDWEGRPVHRSVFDRLIHNFTVSERHGKLYAFSILNPEEIFEYDLPMVIN